jgi:hypothetical protein
LCGHLRARGAVETAATTTAAAAITAAKTATVTAAAAIAAAWATTAAAAAKATAWSTAAAAEVTVKSTRPRRFKATTAAIEILAKLVALAASALSAAFATIPIKTHTLVNTQLSSASIWPAAADEGGHATSPDIVRESRNP